MILQTTQINLTQGATSQVLGTAQNVVVKGTCYSTVPGTFVPLSFVLSISLVGCSEVVEGRGVRFEEFTPLPLQIYGE